MGPGHQVGGDGPAKRGSKRQMGKVLEGSAQLSPSCGWLGYEEKQQVAQCGLQ